MNWQINQVRKLYVLESLLKAGIQSLTNFMGYSDNTNLHLFLWNLGIISYYGGAVMTQFAMGGGMHDYTIDSIDKALFRPSIGEVFPAIEYSDADLDWANKQNLTKKKTSIP